MTQRCLVFVACPLVYDSHLSSTDLCLHHMSGGTRPPHQVTEQLRPPEPWGPAIAVGPFENHGLAMGSSMSPRGGPRRADSTGH